MHASSPKNGSMNSGFGSMRWGSGCATAISNIGLADKTTPLRASCLATQPPLPHPALFEVAHAIRNLLRAPASQALDRGAQRPRIDGRGARAGGDGRSAGLRLRLG